MSPFHKKVILGIILPCFLISLPSCKQNKDIPTVAPPVKVSVMTNLRNAPAAAGKYSGAVSSSQTTNVSFSVSGTITNLYVEEGQKVSKGQLLGKIRDGEYVNALNIANAELAEAQDGYNRLKKLHDANALPEVKWVEIEQKLKQAQNTVEMAQRTVGDANLHSPVNGTVTRKLVDVGQTVIPVQPVYEIVSTEDLTIDVSVSEIEIGNFALGQKADIKFEGSDIGTIEGAVSQKAVTADPLTRTFTVKVKFPSTGGKVLPGMIADVTFENSALGDSESKGYILPSQAVLLSEDNRMFVWIVKDSKAERRFVTVDQLVADGVLVTSGINPTDTVIVAGMQKVGTGTPVIPQMK